jgi:hypothetical protein
MSFNKEQLREIKLNFGINWWNPKKANLLLHYDETQPHGFNIKIIDINDEPEVKDLSMAKEVLKKYTL